MKCSSARTHQRELHRHVLFGVETRRREIAWGLCVRQRASKAFVGACTEDTEAVGKEEVMHDRSQRRHAWHLELRTQM